MPKKKSNKEEYSYLVVRINNFIARVDSSINHEVYDKRYRTGDTKVYSFYTALDISGNLIYPEEDIGNTYHISIYGEGSRYKELDLTLKDCHATDEVGNLKYRKRKGVDEPEYDIPKNIGYIEKVRGEKAWSGAIWVNNDAITNMLTILSIEKESYIEIHKLKVNRNHLIRGFTVQNCDPNAES